jgi:hypothetical protein
MRIVFKIKLDDVESFLYYETLAILYSNIIIAVFSQMVNNYVTLLGELTSEKSCDDVKKIAYSYI